MDRVGWVQYHSIFLSNTYPPEVCAPYLCAGSSLQLTCWPTLASTGLTPFLMFDFVIFQGIFLVFLWYETSPSSCSPLSHAVCQRDILHFWAPVIGLCTLLLLGVLLHSWLLVIRTLRTIRGKKTRIVSKALVGFVDSSHGGYENQRLGGGVCGVGLIRG